MSALKKMIPFRTNDGTTWGVEVAKASSPSSALIIFHHPSPGTGRRDRYAWLNWDGEEAGDVTTNLSPETVRPMLDEHTLNELFVRSMFIGPASVPVPTDA